MKHRFWRKHLIIPFLHAWRSIGAWRVLWWGVVFWAVLAIVASSFLHGGALVNEGQPSPRDLYATQGLTFTSQVLTEKARQDAAREIRPVVRVDRSMILAAEEQAGLIFGIIKDLQAEKQDMEQGNGRQGPTDKELAEGLLARAGLRLPEATARAVVESDQDTLAALQAGTVQIIRQFLLNGVASDAVESVRRQVLDEVVYLDVKPAFRALVTEVLRRVEIKPNLIYDAVETDRLIREAEAAVVPVTVTVLKDEKIVGAREIVTAENLEVLQELGLLRSQANWGFFAGIMLLLLVLFSLLWLYLRHYHPRIYNDQTLLFCLGLILVLTLLVTRGLSLVELSDESSISLQMGYLVPLAAGSMLIAILLDTRLAFFTTIMLSIIVGIITGGQFRFVTVAILGGLAGAYCVSRLQERNDLAKTSLYIMLVNVAGIVSFGLLEEETVLEVLSGSLLGVVNGIISSVLTIGALPFFETGFKITTPVKLLELSNPSQPLLKRLLTEAPGTYHHSLMVGNLAEAAATAIGADALLARVGSYYHDIGKLKRPYFFIENQVTSENPHNRLAPTLSMLIITAHVKDGLELAREARLPGAITQIIAQHHGTSILSFFYHKAKETSRGDTIREGDYRYETPRPQTREAALVMLSDAVEAAVRSLKSPAPGRLEGFVRKLIREKLEDGQLDTCDLTLRDLDKVARSFLKVLNGIFHSRVEYPDTLLKEIERRKVSSDVVVHSKPAG